MNDLRKWTEHIASYLAKHQGGALAAAYCDCPLTPDTPVSDSVLIDAIGTNELSEFTFFIAAAHQTSTSSRRLQLFLRAFDAFQSFHTQVRHQYVGWDTAVLVTLLRTIHQAAQVPDAVNEEAIGHIVRCYRKLFLFLQTADAGYENHVARRRGALAVLNRLLDILFQANNVHQCKAFIATVEQAETLASGDLSKGILAPCGHMVAEVTKYHYYSARMHLFNDEPAAAFAAARSSFSLMPPTEKATLPVAKNKIRVSFYWIIAGLLCGLQAPTWLFDLDPVLGALKELQMAIHTGRLRSFDRVMEKHESLFRLRGSFFLLATARQACTLSALRKVVGIMQLAGGKCEGIVQIDWTRVPVAAVFSVLNSTENEGGEESCQDSESSFGTEHVMMDLAKLIVRKKIKGYLSVEHSMLVLSRKDPFPVQ